tara:strand:- start:770 stop:994 length:225 start_codon:yes stop_codon:yes gene_type:complete
MKATRSNINLSPIKGNRFTGASLLTAREAERLLKFSLAIEKMRKKKNLYFHIEDRLGKLQAQIYEVLVISGRIK